MKRPTPNVLTVHLTVILAVAAVFVAGCGDEPPPANPQQVIETAFPNDAPAGDNTTSAKVEVASLGFEDRVLDSRTLEVNSKTYAEVRKAITGEVDVGWPLRIG
ncbi:MAG: hypothetical protein IPK93_12860 [Solirubrobacterales bacterium]|nr:hypothetical protein [Solirubrobacterales bacterium]